MADLQDQCRRCGTCCRKGGPALHQEDKTLVDSGRIPTKMLFTIRKGEIAYDNVQQRLIATDTDIIKIKGTGNTRACAFLNGQNNQCRIYNHRPMECRILKCWDTTAMEAGYRQGRLTRQHLVGNIAGLWDIVADHQKQCPVEPLKIFSDQLKQFRPVEGALEKQVTYIVRYDLSLRSLVAEKGNMDKAMLPFLFGLPVMALLITMGIKTVREQNRIIYKVL